jgi:excisionase family DNA binding protein
MFENHSREILRGARAIADYLGVSENTVYHMIERRQIPYFKLGRSVCVRRSHLLAQADRLVRAPEYA